MAWWRFLTGKNKQFARKIVERRHVVVCTYGLGAGGAERQWIYLANAIQNTGIRVTFLTYEPLTGANAHYAPMLRGMKVEHLDAADLILDFDVATYRQVQDLRVQFGFGSVESMHIMRISAALKRLRPDVVLAQLDEPNLLAGMAARISGVPIHVMAFRNHSPANFSWIIRPWMKATYRHLYTWEGTRFSANSQAAAKSYGEWLKIPHQAIRVIPNIHHSVHQEPKLTLASERVGNIPKNRRIVLGVFRLHPEKDPEGFVSVAERVCRTRTDVVFVHAGDGPMQNRMRALIAERRLEDKLLLLGHCRDVGSIMRAADLLLHTSRFEGLSNVVMEAQAAGLPVVAYDIDGVRELVLPGVSALLSQPGDEAQLAAHVSFLLEDVMACRRMSAAGRMVSRNRLDGKSVANAYLKLAGFS